MQFKTHTGEIVTGERLQSALKQVANDWRDIARAIRSKDLYASHVTEETKDARLAEALDRADKIEAGNVGSFTIWQRVNTVLTGECVGFLG